MWGANAVNGVINIITQKAEKTQGLHLESGGGEPLNGLSGIRYGGYLTEDAAYRIYAKGYQINDDYLSPLGNPAQLSIDSQSSGFRIDWDQSADAVSLQGDLINGTLEGGGRVPRFPGEGTRNDENLTWYFMTRWHHTFSAKSKTMIKTYYQRDDRKGDFKVDTLDIDVQHDYDWTDDQRIVWGMGYRNIADEMIKGLYGNYTYDPMKREQDVFSVFFQDTLRLVPDHLNLTLGSKYEHNDLTGSEVQPSIRLAWDNDEYYTFWGAVSHAVRTPSRIDADATSKAEPRPLLDTEGPPPPPSPDQIMEIRGNPDFQAENLTAYELGFRSQPGETFWFDLALFYNVYDDLASYLEMEHGVWRIANAMEGEGYGLEVAMDYRPMEGVRLNASWSLLKMALRLKDDKAWDLTGYVERTNPRYQLAFHSAFSLGKNVALDLWVRHVDDIGYMRPYFGSLPNGLKNYVKPWKI